MLRTSARIRYHWPKRPGNYVSDAAHSPTRTNEPKRPAVHVLVEPGVVARTFWLLRRAFIAAFEDGCFGIAKGAAYSFLLALFPVLTTLASLLIHVKATAVVSLIATFVTQVAPPGTDELIVSRLREHGNKQVSLSVIAIIVSLWAASGAMMSLMEGFQAAYRMPSGRPLLKQRGMALFLVLVAAIPAIGASVLVLFGYRLEAAFLHSTGIAERGSDIRLSLRIIGQIVRYVVAFGTTVLVNGLIYYFGPNHRAESKFAPGASKSRLVRVWPGAFLATMMWLLVTAGFAWYVNNIANYNIVYGSLGTIIVLLVWMYLLAVIALIGCEFNAERERIDSLISLY